MTTATRSGTLRKNENRRWEIVNRAGRDAIELSSGSVIEVKIAGRWTRTSIEHNGREYYATTCGVLLCGGMAARLPEVAECTGRPRRKRMAIERTQVLADSIGQGMQAIDRVSETIRRCGFDDRMIASMGLQAGLLLADVRLRAATDDEEAV